MRSESQAICLVVLVSSYMVNASIIAVSNWTHCSSPDSLIVTLWGVSLGMCTEECYTRSACLQYNYRKRRTSCELLSGKGQTPATDKGCVSGGSSNKTTQVCSKLHVDGETVCFKHECGPMSVEQATVYGNVLSMGSKVKIACTSDKNVTTSTCRDNGEWEPHPTCPAVKICPSSDKDFEFVHPVGFLKVCTESKAKVDAATACRPYGALIRIEPIWYYMIIDELDKYIKYTLEPLNEFNERTFWIQGEYNTSDYRWKFNDGTLVDFHTVHQDSLDIAKRCLKLDVLYNFMPNVFAGNCSETLKYICMLI